MTKITPLQDTLPEIVWNIPAQSADFWTKGYWEKKEIVNKLRFFSNRTKFSDEEIREVLLHSIEDGEIKAEIGDVLLDPTNLTALKSLIATHKEDIQHLLHGYKKLWALLLKEKKINELYAKIDALSMQQYINGSSMGRADIRNIRKAQKLEEAISALEVEKTELLDTKEIVAAYELHKLSIYSRALLAGELVQTPSVQETKRDLRAKILEGKTLLLSGPVGTGKTRMAREIYKEILQSKKDAGLIPDEDFHKLRATPTINGHEESSPRHLESRPTQMSNKSDTDKAFIYTKGHINLCLKYWLPLIIDEANRTPPNFLSSLKSYWAYSARDRFEDSITGESFQVAGPLQVIMTANEWSKYSAHTNTFQDQIEREVQREYIGYLPKNEVYDIFKAKLYLQPWIAYVTPEDLSKTLPNLISAIEEVNEHYLSGKEYPLQGTGETTTLKMKSTVLDTKRLLALVNRAKIWSKETFWQEVNEAIVEFISRVNNDNDRKILCGIFHFKDLLCKENIPALLRGSSLSKDVLEAIITTEESQQDKITGARFVSPRGLATTLPYSTYREGKKFEELEYDNQGTILKSISKQINALDLFSELQDASITKKLAALHPSDLEDVFLSILVKLNEQPDSPSSSTLNKVQKILEDMYRIEKSNPRMAEQWERRKGSHSAMPSAAESRNASRSGETSLESMWSLEQSRKMAALKWLEDNNMASNENKAMIDAVRFTDEAIVVGDVRFSNEKLRPQNTQRWTPPYTGYATPSVNKSWLRKQVYNGEEEYYYDLDAYIRECAEQGKTAVMKEDIEQALQALPGTYGVTDRYAWWNILSILLWLSMSGWVYPSGKPSDTGKSGYLGLASPNDSDRWDYKWNTTRGRLDGYRRTYALPALFLLKKPSFPDDLKAYQTRRESGIQGIDLAKRKKIRTVAENLIQSGKVSYEQYPQGGWITHFKGIPGMDDTRFYDATRLVQEETLKGEKMTKTNTYDVFWEQQLNNLVCLRAMRGHVPSTWASRQIGKLVENQRSKYGLHCCPNKKVKTMIVELLVII